MTLKHAQAELKTKQAAMKKMDSGYKKDQDVLQTVRSNREKLQAELAKLNYEGTLCVNVCMRAADCCLSPCYCGTFPITFVTCVQMGRRKVCWAKEESYQEKLLNLRKHMNVLCLASPTYVSTTSKELPN